MRDHERKKSELHEGFLNVYILHHAFGTPLPPGGVKI